MAAIRSATCGGTIGADGTFTGRLGPQGANERWSVISLHTEVTGSAVGAVLRVYEGDVGGHLLDGTYSAEFNAAEITVDLEPGQFLSFYWSDATPGATAAGRARFRLV